MWHSALSHWYLYNPCDRTSLMCLYLFICCRQTPLCCFLVLCVSEALSSSMTEMRKIIPHPFPIASRSNKRPLIASSFLRRDKERDRHKNSVDIKAGLKETEREKEMERNSGAWVAAALHVGLGANNEPSPVSFIKSAWDWHLNMFSSSRFAQSVWCFRRRSPH